MSQRGYKSRQIGPSFLRGRRIVPPRAMRGRVPRRKAVLEQAAMRRFRSLRRGAGLPGMPRSMQIMKRSSHVFLPCLSGHTLRANSGAHRHCATLLSGLLSQNESGPLLQNARLGAWEPGPLHPSAQRPRAGDPVILLRLRQWMTRPIREFNLGDFTMYQNRITLIGFLGNDAIIHRPASNWSASARRMSTKTPKARP